ncbi:hypothetical protein MRS76_19990 [Rhizobiaceae bacterium n13]|uniref:Uncharacterized protein n=1 Tax=Ferirhizobium litorale TaxID=2927786 RepID=A0AAE3QH59_9HYPH|nr:hypothetical protein [Fererhizobium litorale]MDI7864222.1 hypothetical protein [Fererhizobium litorale]MDI7925135.1 hypothetical protein [Fererhizobium litorale]
MSRFEKKPTTTPAATRNGVFGSVAIHLANAMDAVARWVEGFAIRPSQPAYLRVRSRDDMYGAQQRHRHPFD